MKKVIASILVIAFLCTQAGPGAGTALALRQPQNSQSKVASEVAQAIGAPGKAAAMGEARAEGKDTVSDGSSTMPRREFNKVAAAFTAAAAVLGIGGLIGNAFIPKSVSIVPKPGNGILKDSLNVKHHEGGVMTISAAVSPEMASTTDPAEIKVVLEKLTMDKNAKGVSVAVLNNAEFPLENIDTLLVASFGKAVDAKTIVELGRLAGATDVVFRLDKDLLLRAENPDDAYSVEHPVYIIVLLVSPSKRMDRFRFTVKVETLIKALMPEQAETDAGAAGLAEEIAKVRKIFGFLDDSFDLECEWIRKLDGDYNADRLAHGFDYTDYYETVYQDKHALQTTIETTDDTIKQLCEAALPGIANVGEQIEKIRAAVAGQREAGQGVVDFYEERFKDTGKVLTAETLDEIRREGSRLVSTFEEAAVQAKAGISEVRAIFIEAAAQVDAERFIDGSMAEKGIKGRPVAKEILMDIAVGRLPEEQHTFGNHIFPIASEIYDPNAPGKIGWEGACEAARELMHMATEFYKQNVASAASAGRPVYPEALRQPALDEDESVMNANLLVQILDSEDGRQEVLSRALQILTTESSDRAVVLVAMNEIDSIAMEVREDSLDGMQNAQVRLSEAGAAGAGGAVDARANGHRIRNADRPKTALDAREEIERWAKKYYARNLTLIIMPHPDANLVESRVFNFHLQNYRERIQVLDLYRDPILNALRDCAENNKNKKLLLSLSEDNNTLTVVPAESAVGVNRAFAAGAAGIAWISEQEALQQIRGLLKTRPAISTIAVVQAYPEDPSGYVLEPLYNAGVDDTGRDDILQRIVHSGLQWTIVMSNKGSAAVLVPQLPFGDAKDADEFVKKNFPLGDKEDEWKVAAAAGAADMTQVEVEAKIDEFEASGEPATIICGDPLLGQRWDGVTNIKRAHWSLAVSFIDNKTGAHVVRGVVQIAFVGTFDEAQVFQGKATAGSEPAVADAKGRGSRGPMSFGRIPGPGVSAPGVIRGADEDEPQAPAADEALMKLAVELADECPADVLETDLSKAETPGEVHITTAVTLFFVYKTSSAKDASEGKLLFLKDPQNIISVIRQAQELLKGRAAQKIGLVVADSEDEAITERERLLAFDIGLVRENIELAWTQEKINALNGREFDFIRNVATQHTFEGLPAAGWDASNIEGDDEELKRAFIESL